MLSGGRERLVVRVELEEVVRRRDQAPFGATSGPRRRDARGPYAKWLGTAFGQLGDDELGRHLRQALQAVTSEQRQAAMARDYTALARWNDDVGLTDPVDPAIRTYYGRPAQVLMAGRFADACLRTVTDPALRALPLIGAVDQLCDSSDLFADPATYRKLAAPLSRPAVTAHR